MNRKSEDDEPGLTVLEAGDLMGLLDNVRNASYAAGRACAYRDVMASVIGERAKLEDELTRAKPSSLHYDTVAGELMAVARLWQAFDGAADHYQQRANEITQRVIRDFMRAGLVGGRTGNAIGALMDVLTTIDRHEAATKNHD